MEHGPERIDDIDRANNEARGLGIMPPTRREDNVGQVTETKNE